jgi:alpha-1,6-mannosyltransferase
MPHRQAHGLTQSSHSRIIVWWPSVTVSIIAISSALALVLASNKSAALQLISILSIMFVGFASIIWIFLDKRFQQIPLYWIFFLALILRIIAAQAIPLLEDDQYRYLWDGFRTATQLDPYRQAPSVFIDAANVSDFWKDILLSINHPEIPTIYGPVLQLLFATAYFISPGDTHAIQWLLVAADMLVIYLLTSANVERKLLLIYAIHPLVLKEAMASAHPDGLVALFLILAMLFWKKRLGYCVGIALGFAVVTKVSSLIALPFFCFLFKTPSTFTSETRSLSLRILDLYKSFSWAWFLKVSLASGVTVLMLYLPFFIHNQGASDAQALSIFTNEWRFNPLGFKLFDVLLSEPFSRISAGIVLLCGLLGLFWHWLLKNFMQAMHPLDYPPLDYVFLLLLFLSPVVNPWYWLWILAPSLLLGRRFVLIIAAVAMLSYLNTSVFADIPTLAQWWLAFDTEESIFRVIFPATILQIIIIIAALINDFYWQSRRDNNATTSPRSS